MVVVSNGVLEEVVRKHLPRTRILRIQDGEESKVAFIEYDSGDPTRKRVVKVVYGGRKIPEKIQERLGYHPSIMQVYQTKQDGKLAITIAEYVVGKTLRELIGGREDSIPDPIPEEAKKSIAKELINVLAYIQCRGLWYRDLRAENIMIENPEDTYLKPESLRLKLVDLDDIVEDKKDKSDEHRRIKTSRITTYALGRILYEMFTGSTPEEASRKKGRNAINDINEYLTKEIKEFFGKMFALPEKRYETMDEVRDGLERSGLFTRSFLELVDVKEKNSWLYGVRESVMKTTKGMMEWGRTHGTMYVAEIRRKIGSYIIPQPPHQPKLEQATTK